MTNRDRQPQSALQPPFVLALDIGTSSVRAILFDRLGNRVPAALARRQYGLRTTPDGGVEADADEMLAAVEACLDELTAMGRLDVRPIVAVATSTLVSNVLGLDEDDRSATPVYLYSDTRNTAAVAQLSATLDEHAVHQRTGCPFHTSYSPARLLWLRGTYPHPTLSLVGGGGASPRPSALLAASPFGSPGGRGRVWRWLSIGEYMLLRFLGRATCSLSVASWTGLLNRHTLAWDEELLAALPVGVHELPSLSDDPIAGLLPAYAQRWPALREALWFPAWGDGACSNIGSGCTTPMRVALSVGTSGAMRIVRRGKTERIPWGLWEYRVDRNRTLVGGALSNAGSVALWLREVLGLGELSGLDARVAAMPPDVHGLTVLPFLAGERSPGWTMSARAAIVGLSLHTQPLDILRAGLEAVAYRFALIYDLLKPLVAPAHQIIASGGAIAALPCWGQILADVLDQPVMLLAEFEASARGAALLALDALGLLPIEDAPFPASAQVSIPDRARHQRYAEAVARQQRLYGLLINPTLPDGNTARL